MVGDKRPPPQADPGQSRSRLVERLRATLADHEVSEQKMFGGVCFMLNGNMVAGTLRNELLVRVGKEGNAAALRRPHSQPMDHMGRPAPGYVMVASEGTDRDADLKSWVDLAVAFVSTLPAKSRKAPSRKKSRTPTGRK
jgi:TfoX/Sxy family transcriptional regulator of competence genes